MRLPWIPRPPASPGQGCVIPSQLCALPSTSAHFSPEGTNGYNEGKKCPPPGRSEIWHVLCFLSRLRARLGTELATGMAYQAVLGVRGAQPPRVARRSGHRSVLAKAARYASPGRSARTWPVLDEVNAGEVAIWIPFWQKRAWRGRWSGAAWGLYARIVRTRGSPRETPAAPLKF